MRPSTLHRLFGLAVLSLVPVSAAHAQQGALRGDVDADGRVTAADAQAVRDHVAGRAAQPGIVILPNGDANGDGRITGVDAAMIQAFAAGRDLTRFGVGKPVPGGEAGGSLTLAYECTVDVEAGTQSCQTPRPSGAAADVLLGKPYIAYVTTGAATSRGNTADEDTTSMNVALTNQIEQPIGTTDGTTAAASGNRIYFADGPRITAVTSGTLASATVRLEGTDGTADFSAPGGTPLRKSKPYFQYDGVLAKGATSSPKPWRFVYSPNTKTFTYAVHVSAPVQYEYGWATVSESAQVLRAEEEGTPLTATVRDFTGVLVSDGVTWSSSDSTVATVDANTGVVTAVARGVATITATSSARAQRTGSMTVAVGALWTGTSSADWNQADNWLLGVVADSTRDAIIPATAPRMPSLTSAGYVLNLDIASGVTVNLNGFTMEMHGALHGAGSVAGGTLWQRGGVVQGTLPSLLITSGVSVQAATRTTGAVNVRDGSLAISGAPLSIAIP
ncbi:MAG TPA: dockerin type I domain-containing protein [Longimicrobium sp.]|jgi:hypothetical protein